MRVDIIKENLEGFLTIESLDVSKIEEQEWCSDKAIILTTIPDKNEIIIRKEDILYYGPLKFILKREEKNCLNCNNFGKNWEDDTEPCKSCMESKGYPGYKLNWEVKE